MHLLLTGVLALPLLGQSGWLLPPPPDNPVSLSERIREGLRHPLALAPEQSVAPGGAWRRLFFAPVAPSGTRVVPNRSGSLTFLAPPARPKRVVLDGSNRTLAAQSASPCAVPLVNMLRSPSSGPRMPTVRPPAGAFHTRDVKVPAPSCEDTDTR